MRAWHCSLCGLDFGFRTELEWHVRENHLSRHYELTASPGNDFAGGARRDWDQLHELQAVVDYPCVSLLLGTVPSRAMTPIAAVRLDLLRAHAQGRLVQELSGKALRDLQERSTSPARPPR